MAKRPVSGVEALREAFRAAPFEENGWDAALRALARQTRSTRAQIRARGNPHGVPVNHVTELLSPEWYREFASIRGGSPQSNWRMKAIATRAPLALVTEADFEAARAGGKFDLYDDFVAKYDMRHGCQTALLENGEILFGLALLRSDEDGRTTEQDRAVFASAVPEALTAARTQYALEREGMKLVAGAMDSMQAAAFVVDPTGRVGAMTRPAEDLLLSGRGVCLNEGTLLAMRAGDDGAFQRALAAALCDDPAARTAARLWLRTGSEPLAGFVCEVFPLPRRELSFGFDARALVVLREPNRHGARERRLLEQTLGLTRAEAEVALLAAEGLSREEIAARRNASPATVGTQMKAIFAKSVVNREAELVALVHRILR